MAKLIDSRTIVVDQEYDVRPCPFCASEHLRFESKDMGGGYTAYHVVCNRCGATGPFSGYKKSMADEKQYAIKLWNGATT